MHDKNRKNCENLSLLTVKIRNRTINAKCLAWDLTLWLVSFFELAYLELYYLNIITF